MTQPACGRGVVVIVKRVLLVAAITAIGLVAWYATRASSKEEDASAAGSPPNTDRPPIDAEHPPRHVVKLANADERRRIAERIDRAHVARAALHAPRPPSLPSLPPSTLDPNDESFKTTLRDAMHEVVPILGECYERALPQLASPTLRVTAKLTLSGDPDIGTLIDARQLEGDAPIPTELDACLRDTLQKLELPPLVEGDEVRVAYPLVFRSE